MKAKKQKITTKQILSLILAVIIGFMFIRFFIVVIPKDAEAADTSKGIEYLEAMESADGDKRVEEVRAVQKSYTRKAVNSGAQQAIKNNNFRPAFKDIVIVGDSIVEAISGYNILDTDQVIAVIGSGTSLISERMNDIVKAKPKVIVLHFGLNTMQGKSAATAFINEYEKQIKLLQKKMPNAKIYVDSILPVSKGVIKSQPKYKNIPYYNSLIKKMAQRLKLKYIDVSALWKTYDTNYFDADGIHPIKTYYTEKYLPTILKEVGADIV